MTKSALDRAANLIPALPDCGYKQAVKLVRHLLVCL